MSHWAEIKVSGLCSFWTLWERICFLAFASLWKLPTFLGDIFRGSKGRDVVIVREPLFCLPRMQNH